MPEKTVDGVMLLSWVRNSTSAPISGGISVGSSGLRASEPQWEQLLIYIGSRCDPPTGASSIDAFSIDAFSMVAASTSVCSTGAGSMGCSELNSDHF